MLGCKIQTPQILWDKIQILKFHDAICNLPKIIGYLQFSTCLFQLSQPENPVLKKANTKYPFG